MFDLLRPTAAIVDYGLGNLFSVRHACERVGMHTTITASPREILGASAVILPGVGAFGDAMETLERLDLVGVLRDVATSGKPLLGVCLGMQLLMTESHEFGWHRGLGIFKGEVIRLKESRDGARRLKVPHVGWNQIHGRGASADSNGWVDTVLDGLASGEFMYFVHSFYARPADTDTILSTTRYGEIEFCSSARLGNVFGCQFHPERSGKQGLRVYRNFMTFAEPSIWEKRDA